MTIPATKTARQARVTALVNTGSVRSQAELADLLKRDGLYVTQATLSRDLVELGAVRIRNGRGNLVYALPQLGSGDISGGERSAETVDGRLASLCKELLVTAEASANLVVLRTPPGAAQYFASVIDQSTLHHILGTIAGDDTVVVITREPDGGEGVAEYFLALTSRD
ncbi:MAG: arginine repressor [Kocuria sp.]|nr:arginine repressor [Kocuria sp.]